MFIFSTKQADVKCVESVCLVDVEFRLEVKMVDRGARA
jgi:hypothetical protein